MRKILLAILFSTWAPVASATEIDDTTSYYWTIHDSEALLNLRTQELIQEGASRHYGCDRRTLARQMGAVLVGNLFYGTVESFANNSALVDRVYIPAAESIYKNTPYSGGFVDTFVNLGPTVNVAGFHIGTDKLGHFMDMGYDLYLRSRDGEGVLALLAQSHREEGGLWGSLMTGVKSYGDIAANFDGHRFWQDLIEEGPRGFFVCEGGRIKQVRDFKWSDYVSAAWTEAINCSSYWSDSYTKPIAANIDKLESAQGHRFRCPIEPSQCGILRDYYAHWIPREKVDLIVSPACSLTD